MGRNGHFQNSCKSITLVFELKLRISRAFVGEVQSLRIIAVLIDKL